MFCKECGKQIADDAKFCSHCGTKLSLTVVREKMDLVSDNSAPESNLQEPSTKKFHVWALIATIITLIMLFTRDYRISYKDDFKMASIFCLIFSSFISFLPLVKKDLKDKKSVVLFNIITSLAIILIYFLGAVLKEGGLNFTFAIYPFAFALVMHLMAYSKLKNYLQK